MTETRLCQITEAYYLLEMLSSICRSEELDVLLSGDSTNDIERLIYAYLQGKGCLLDDIIKLRGINED